MVDINKPNRCPKCGRHSMPIGERKKSRYATVVYVYAKLDRRSINIGYSSINKVGWICKNCGYYELNFIPEEYKKYLEEVAIDIRETML